MMFEKILDEESIESEFKEIDGFGRLKGAVTFTKDKIVKKGSYNIFGLMVDGYEIHNGITKKRCKSAKNLYGTFIHGLFDNDSMRAYIFKEINPDYQGYNFKEYKKNAIAEFADHIDKNINMPLIIDALYD